ncbi:MAG: ABC transporter ATP-binding protein [candidate division KSB1 bacterium]|nr:ABC transporter ATP-binding protein [candidate division KSB1 bacterium]MDQ7063191.1 ABC transporter ATP-binding protein [candidate division KSB1 bacterium]
MAIIRAEQLSKHFQRGKVKALDGLTLSVEKGSIFGLLGPNGAGKTTFLKILLGLLRPTHGQAFLFDIPVQQHRAREKVGFLPENHRFPLYLNGEDFLFFCARLSGMRDQDQIRKNAERLLKRVRMWEWRKVIIKKYSKGMMQRLGLAHALISDPELIFLDEPTDGVDPIGRKEIRDLLLELKQQGKTIFLNSHLLSEVESVCDEVVILNRGKVVLQGLVKKLTTLDRRYRIHADFQNAGLVDAIRQSCDIIEAKPTYVSVAVPSVRVLNQIIDEIRRAGVLIQSVIPERQSLEDSFILAIQQDGKADFDQVALEPVTEEGRA